MDCLWLLLLNLEWAGTWAVVLELLTTCSEISGHIGASGSTTGPTLTVAYILGPSLGQTTAGEGANGHDDLMNGPVLGLPFFHFPFFQRHR